MLLRRTSGAYCWTRIRRRWARLLVQRVFMCTAVVRIHWLARPNVWWRAMKCMLNTVRPSAYRRVRRRSRQKGIIMNVTTIRGMWLMCCSSLLWFMRCGMPDILAVVVVRVRQSMVLVTLTLSLALRMLLRMLIRLLSVRRTIPTQMPLLACSGCLQRGRPSCGSGSGCIRRRRQ